MSSENIPDDFSDLNSYQKAELQRLKNLVQSMTSTEEAVKAGLILYQDDYKKIHYFNLPFMFMVIHEDSSYTMYRKTGDLKTLRIIRRGRPD